MLQSNSKDNDRRKRMEVEANRFASLVLIPPPVLREALKHSAEPDLQDIPRLARRFKVSKEAMARAYAQYHHACIAIVVIQKGRILRCYKSVDFPFIETSGNVPPQSAFHRLRLERGIASDFVGCTPEVWLAPNFKKRLPAMYEQFYLQQEGFALICLQVERVDEDEEQEVLDLERSWQVNFPARKRRR